MRVDLSGLRALVTGSTKGIGRAVAELLAANSAEVVINGRKTADVERAIAEIKGKLPAARLVAAPGDAATAQGVATIIGAAGDIDILVNNVGVFEIKDAFDIPDADWQRLFETNVLSGVRFSARSSTMRGRARSSSDWRSRRRSPRPSRSCARARPASSPVRRYGPTAAW